jgi:hypothetical protein
MKKYVTVILAIGVLAAGRFICQQVFTLGQPCYSPLSQARATELSSQTNQYSKWVGEWAPEKGLELPEAFYVQVKLDASGLPVYEVHFLTGRYRKDSATPMEVMEMLDLSPEERSHTTAGIPGDLSFEISLTYNPQTDKMEWTGTAYGNRQIISEKKLVLIRRENSELAADSIPFKVERVKADMRSMATGIEAYFVDCCCYPAWVPGDHPLAFNKAPATKSMPSFRLGVKGQNQYGGETVVPFTLTTPISYIISYFEDPFRVSPTDPQPTFAYYADTNGWILVSPGPDGDYDIDPELDYRSDITQPSEEILVKGYDPTNGFMSNGDVFRVKQ